MDGDSKRCRATQLLLLELQFKVRDAKARVRKCVPWLGQNTPVEMGFKLVPVAVLVVVLTVQLDDVEVDAADVIVLLVVAHDIREMSAANTIQKRSALNNMMAVSFKGDVEHYSERHDIDWGYIYRCRCVRDLSSMVPTVQRRLTNIIRY